MTGEQIVELRSWLGFTQHDLAKCLNVQVVTVKCWETARGLAPKGAALDVLYGIRQAVMNVGSAGPERDARVEHIAGRLRLGIGSVIAYGLLDLVNKLPRCECGLAGRCDRKGTIDSPCVFVRREVVE